MLDNVADALLLGRARPNICSCSPMASGRASHVDADRIDARFWRALDGVAHGPAYIKTAAWDVVA